VAYKEIEPTGSNSEVPDISLGGAQTGLPLCHWLFWQKFLVGFFTPHMQMSKKHI